MWGLALEYLGLVFVAAVGVLQVAATYNELKGISFFGRKICGYLFATLTVAPALALFFTWNYRNEVGIIEGAQQSGLFVLAVIAALIFTLVISSLLNKKRLQENHPEHDGLEALRQVTFFQALRHRFGGRQ